MYSEDQKRLLRALHKTRTTPWHLAGQWYGGEKHPGLDRLTRPALDPALEAQIHAAWRLSKARPTSFEGGLDQWSNWPMDLLQKMLNNKLAFVCSCLLWEALFPDEFPGETIRSATADLVDLAVNDMPSWVATRLDPTTPLASRLFDMMAGDSVRIAGGEMPEGF